MLKGFIRCVVCSGAAPRARGRRAAQPGQSAQCGGAQGAPRYLTGPVSACRVSAGPLPALVCRGRSRARPERLEEEYYAREQYHRYPREYPRDYHEGYAGEYRGDEAYGHDYTREYAREFPREFPREERGARARDREPGDEFAPSRRALNAL
ncbi:unnamed protein product [Colias eurytheme]|nr:unnamed protein product [Colias eurytheme]